MDHHALIQRAAEAIGSADALLITAGAGMGVDSGLPDFRGPQGFWRAYPPYAKLGLNFIELANPRWFARDPALAWGFYGHRLITYRSTTPHHGFAVLRNWAARAPHGAFVFTSNVDGHFQRAGFEQQRVAEVHGSVHWMQCTRRCGVGIFPADDTQVAIHEETMRAIEPLPRCPSCGELARPNVLMFNDWEWEDDRTMAQMQRLEDWLGSLRGRLVIVECGAGRAVPTVRSFSERIAISAGALLVRINLREPEAPDGHLGLSVGARECLQRIHAHVAGARA
jgi:NAD-dependent SIR2 family protein deacetylase